MRFNGLRPRRGVFPVNLRGPGCNNFRTASRGMQVASACSRLFIGDLEMGKYVLAWLLGVPGIVLVLVYIFFH